MKEVTNENYFPIDDSDEEWKVHLNTNGTNIRYKIDSGAQVNILPLHAYHKLYKKPTVKKANVKLTAYNGSDIPVIGKCIVRLKNEHIPEVPVLFVIADTVSPPIIGLLIVLGN